MATEISFEPTTVNLIVYKGDSINIKFTLKEDGQDYVIPSNGTWKGNIENPAGVALTTSGSTTGTFVLTGNNPNTYFIATVPSTTTSNFVVGTEYKYDIQYTWTDSVTNLRTFVKGSITVLDEVTT